MPSFQLNDSVPTPAHDYAADLARRLQVETPNPYKYVKRDWVGDVIKYFYRHPVVTRVVLISIALALLVLIIYKAGLFDYLKERFALRRTTPTWDESTVDTDIYAHDLPNELQQATEEDDFPELVKLLYLTALRTLCDRGRLEWLPARTPSDYVRLLEESDAAETSAMRRLTRHYLYVCYGHYATDAPLVGECRELLAQIEQQPQKTSRRAEKGGEQ